MRDIKFTLLAPPEILKNDVECIRLAEYSGAEKLEINVCPAGMSGMFVQLRDGRSAMENITTRSGRSVTPPALFIAGQSTEPSVIRVTRGVFTMVIFKPHGLKTLLGINAAALTDGYVEPDEFAAGNLASQLFEAPDEQARLALLTGFLVAQRSRAKTRDHLVEESIRLINQNIGSITVKFLLEQLHLSERQFEKRFIETVGISPLFYMRLRRFNKAAHLLQTRQFHTLGELAHALHYYDQSHFIRDVQAFSGVTPKHIIQKTDDLHHDRVGTSFV